MKVYIWWSSDEATHLKNAVAGVLEELGLTDFVALEQWQDEELKKKLSISKDSALVIEEESIDFQDMIFEGMVPEAEELKSMFVSIIWGGSGGWCAPGWCGSWCSC